MKTKRQDNGKKDIYPKEGRRTSYHNTTQNPDNENTDNENNEMKTRRYDRIWMEISKKIGKQIFSRKENRDRNSRFKVFFVDYILLIYMKDINEKRDQNPRK